MYRPGRVSNRTTPLVRIFRTFMYLCLVVLGICTLFVPSPTLDSVAGAPFLLDVWSAFLILGGAAGAWGAGTDRWLGESIGLPLLISALGLYGIGWFYAFLQQGHYARLFAASVFIGFGFGLAARLADIRTIRITATRAVEDGRQHRRKMESDS